jgi:hypothetical protein
VIECNEARNDLGRAEGAGAPFVAPAISVGDGLIELLVQAVDHHASRALQQVTSVQVRKNVALKSLALA